MKPPTRASIERHKVSACDGKVRFASAKLANEVAKRRNGTHRKGQSGAYHCKFCGGYHIGPRVDTIAKLEKRRQFLREAEDDPDFA